MRTLVLADTTVRITGGSDREGGGDGPLVVLFHGFGAPGDDLVPLWRQVDVPSGTRFAFPEAPLKLDLGSTGLSDSRAWWMIDLMALEQAQRTGALRDLSQQVPAGLRETRERVILLLDELERELGAHGSRTVLGGFSQGAMLACDVALESDRPLAGLIQLSGTLIREPEWVALMPRRRGLPVLQSHGRQDPLLSFALAERLRDLLLAAGLKVEWLPFNGGHGIAAGALDALGPFVARACRPTP